MEYFLLILCYLSVEIYLFKGENKDEEPLIWVLIAAIFSSLVMGYMITEQYFQMNHWAFFPVIIGAAVLVFTLIVMLMWGFVLVVQLRPNRAKLIGIAWLLMGISSSALLSVIHVQNVAGNIALFALYQVGFYVLYMCFIMLYTSRVPD